MPGTLLGGKRAAKTNKKRYGKNWYREIGKLSHPAWVRNGRKPRGFAYNRELARTAGAKGGRISRRRKQNETQP